jgi:hypothetical protein
MLAACNSYLFFTDAETTTASQRAERLEGVLKEASLALSTLVSEDPTYIPSGQGPESRLTSENLAWVDEKLKEPGWARQFLISAGILDSDGHWNRSYWPDDGEAGNTLGYYMDHPEFYCDLKEDVVVQSVYSGGQETDQDVFEEQSNKPTRSEILSWIEDRSAWGSDDYLGRVALIVEEALAYWSPKSRRGAVSPPRFAEEKPL